MNNLSWFLYFAEVIPNIGATVVIISAVVIFGWFFRNLVVGCVDYPFQGVITGKVNPLYRVPVIALFLIVLAQAVPSKETIYLIAGSEAGEAVVTSEQGQKVINNIQEIIDHQLSRLKGNEE